MQLVISIDVEEEGLFSGRYPRTPKGVANVAALNRLAFIPREFGFPLTLLVTYQVASNPTACKVLVDWRERFGAEIGLHLHPWNTPPFAAPSQPEPVPAEKLPKEILREKLVNLKAKVESACGETAASFRMGRFDAGVQLFNLLPELGIRVDSSIVPLSRKGADPGAFLAPADPYRRPDTPGLLEVPLTMVAVWRRSPAIISRLAAVLAPVWDKRLKGSFRYVGAAGVQPAWYSLAAMRLAARLHRQRGGQVITMFFHSSELMPGATRLFPDEAAVARFVGKIRAFLEFLVASFPVTGTTLAALGDRWPRPRLQGS